MSSSKKPFVLKYVLPDGTVAGYHGCSGCSIVSKKAAKVYSSECNPQEIVVTVKNNFLHVWNTMDGYATHETWKGCTKPEEINVEYVYVPNGTVSTGHRRIVILS